LAILLNPGNPGHELTLEAAKVAARSLGVQVVTVEVRGPEEFGRAFAAIARERAGGLFVPWDGSFLVHLVPIVQAVAKARLPALYGQRRYVDVGGLACYGPSALESFRRAAAYVDKILKGGKPGDLPVEQPTQFELVINLKAANALGLTMSPSLLQRADQVIE
jgi:putative ABC transport system substrate-binding protein